MLLFIVSVYPPSPWTMTGCHSKHFLLPFCGIAHAHKPLHICLAHFSVCYTIKLSEIYNEQQWDGHKCGVFRVWELNVQIVVFQLVSLSFSSDISSETWCMLEQCMKYHYELLFLGYFFLIINKKYFHFEIIFLFLLYYNV